MLNKIVVRPRPSVPEIKSLIEAAFRRHAELDARKIGVEAHEGRVTLHGTLPSRAEPGGRADGLGGAGGLRRREPRRDRARRGRALPGRRPEADAEPQVTTLSGVGRRPEAIAFGGEPDRRPAKLARWIMTTAFRDRTEAGRLLAGKLAGFAGRPDVLVLGLPRGGMPVAYEVARALGVPLDVFVVRKLGVPGQQGTGHGGDRLERGPRAQRRRDPGAEHPGPCH